MKESRAPPLISVPPTGKAHVPVRTEIPGQDGQPVETVVISSDEEEERARAEGRSRHYSWGSPHEWRTDAAQNFV